VKRPDPDLRADVEGEARYVYYGETDSGRLLAVVEFDHQAWPTSII